MADIPLDPNPELRAELEAALAVLEPELRGLRDLFVVSISAPLQSSVNEQILVRQRRVDLINATLAALDGVVTARTALEADGYPALPDAPLPADQFTELQGQDADFKAAIGVFEVAAATTVTVNLGDPVPKPPSADSAAAPAPTRRR
jgi:hypothetical protein